MIILLFLQIPVNQRAALAETSKFFHQIVSDPSVWPVIDVTALGNKFNDAALVRYASSATQTLVLVGPKAVKPDTDSKTINPINDDGIATALQKCTALTKLDLSNMRHLKKPLFGLIGQHCAHLRFLSVKNCRVVTDEELQSIVAGCPQLEVLDVSNCKRISGDGFGLISRLPRLRELVLHGATAITAAAIANIASSCHLITRLDLRFCHEVTDDVVKTVATHLPLLEQLDLGYDLSITMASIHYLQPLLNLVVLNMKECHNIKRDEMDAFTTAHPDCKVYLENDPQ